MDFTNTSSTFSGRPELGTRSSFSHSKYIKLVVIFCLKICTCRLAIFFLLLNTDITLYCFSSLKQPSFLRIQLEKPALPSLCPCFGGIGLFFIFRSFMLCVIFSLSSSITRSAFLVSIYHCRDNLPRGWLTWMWNLSISIHAALPRFWAS